MEVGRPVRRPWRSQEGRTGLSEVGGGRQRRGETRQVHGWVEEWPWLGQAAAMVVGRGMASCRGTQA